MSSPELRRRSLENQAYGARRLAHPLSGVCEDPVPVPGSPVRVLFVAGVSHCGSTLLGSLLGQAEGAFFAGELGHTARALERDLDCGCGEPLRACPVWREVFAQAFGREAAEHGSPELLRLEHRDERARAVARHVLRGRGLLPRAPELERRLDALTATLRGIREVTGAEVVVDSTKSPAYGWLLASREDVDLRVVHLVRDPRATAWSWRRTPELSVRPATLALVWDVWNPVIEALFARDGARYLRLRYEDLVREPRVSLGRVLTLAGLRPDAVPFVSERLVDVQPRHSTSGNRNRFRAGPVEIALDRSWEDAGPFPGLRTVSALTRPLRRRYGY